MRIVDAPHTVGRGFQPIGTDHGKQDGAPLHLLLEVRHEIGAERLGPALGAPFSFEGTALQALCTLCSLRRFWRARMLSASTASENAIAA